MTCFNFSNFRTTRNPYEIAIITYALHLQESPSKDAAYQRMLSFARRTTDFTWWTDSNEQGEQNTTDKQSAHWFLPKSTEIEMTAYGLMTLVLRGDIEGAIPVMRWLVSKQNSNGGFASTQDTVIAIQALGMMASRITSNSLNLDVKFHHFDTVPRTVPMSIVNDNSMVFQKVNLPKQTRFVEVEASGFGFGVVQVSWKYNLAVSAEQPAFFMNPLVGKTSTENYLQLNICG